MHVSDGPPCPSSSASKHSEPNFLWMLTLVVGPKTSVERSEEAVHCGPGKSGADMKQTSQAMWMRLLWA